MPNTDINGDGRDDVLWRRTDGTFTAISGSGAYAHPDLNFQSWVWVPLTWKLEATGDFNGDGRDDVFWRNDDGRMSNWLGLENGGLFDNAANALTHVPIEWRVANAGDFNDDGCDDILWRHDDGRLSNWLGLSNGGFLDNASNGLIDVPTTWFVVGVGDFNGDCRDDILWRDGRLSNWLGLPNGGLASVERGWHWRGSYSS